MYNFKLYQILERRFGDRAKVITDKDLFNRQGQELEILREDPSGLQLALHLVNKVSGEDEARRRGVMVAANRYRDLHGIALGT